jgi:hypothetical protein
MMYGNRERRHPPAKALGPAPSADAFAAPLPEAIGRVGRAGGRRGQSIDLMTLLPHRAPSLGNTKRCAV